ncbi:hypothetical protein DQP55_08780 [Mycolicibacterium sp. GF69]|uniref:hypothetical protein n=1 Tax=Mycolicibacterium sp. GF69 TaxID=2267251 RepID=UPI000DCD7130|nr:hypothetical protein [Mycolicibacterium sp. GF69]RAV14645.1 hypothetical protein DQP55_08780 [Mycolicibacterium sp. GF69]
MRGGVDTEERNSTATQNRKPATGTETTSGAEGVKSETAPADEAETTPSAESETATGADAQVTETEAATEELATDTEPAAESPVQTVPADASATPASSTPTPAADTAPTTPNPLVSAIEDNPVTAAPRTTGPITNAFFTINDAIGTWSQSLVALQTSRTPVTDAITSLQTMLTTVVGAVTRVPGDFYDMLGIEGTTPAPQSLIGGSGSLHTGKVSAPADGPLVGPHAGEPVYVAPTAHSAALFGTMTPRPEQGKVPSGAAQPLSVSGTVPVATAATPVSAKSIFEHVIEAVLVPASLTALAAVALPGVGALLVVAAAGVRVGYRQAKAGLALRASGIARFAGSGPLGVARSGSMVALRQRARGPRTRRAVCPEAAREAAREARGLERVA